MESVSEEAGEHNINADATNNDVRLSSATTATDSQIPRASPHHQHSYLPGASHPLYAEPDLLHRNSIPVTNTVAAATMESTKNQQQHLTQLTVLELPGVVLFPGSTLPVRLNGSWTAALARQIHESRRHPASTAPVRLGVLTAVQREDQEWSAARNRRQSWTRRGLGPTRLRRLSQQIVLELGDLAESDSDDDHADNESTIAATATERDSATAVHAQGAGRQNADVLEFSTEEQRQRTRNLDNNANRERQPYIGRIGTMALITSTHGDAAMDATTAVGVDGIISGFTASSPSSQWRSPQDQGEIVVTALGTSRFRIHSFVNSDEADAASRNPTGRILGGARTFWVQELVDEPLSLPPLNLRHFGAQSQAVATQTTIPTLSYHNRLIHGLSTVSPLPSFVYQLAWPWKMVADIVQAVKRVSIFSGFSDSIPSLEDNDNSGSTYRFLEPLAFSFWMASNIPLSENEKLALLEMHSTVERLQYIRHKIAGEERIESYIHCKSCGIPLSRATFMFSVGGAEGTTGAYVNEHGFIHQTITVRQVCENEVWFTGELETRDSWFDGYAWQIMSCQFCNSHLGWKFRRVPEGDNAAATAPDRLELFYGLSAASVALHGASTSNGRIYR